MNNPSFGKSTNIILKKEPRAFLINNQGVRYFCILSKRDDMIDNIAFLASKFDFVNNFYKKFPQLKDFWGFEEKFGTSSAFIDKLKTPKKIIMESIENLKLKIQKKQEAAIQKTKKNLPESPKTLGFPEIPKREGENSVEKLLDYFDEIDKIPDDIYNKHPKFEQYSLKNTLILSTQKDVDAFNQAYSKGKKGKKVKLEQSKNIQTVNTQIA